MAISVENLALDLRLIVDPADTIEPGQIEILNRLLAVAETLISERASGAPDALKDSAVISLASYLYDRPTAGAAGRYANAFVNSGAASLLSNYIRRRAKAIGPGGEAVVSVAAAPIVLLNELVIPDPGNVVTPSALTLAADLAPGRDLEFLDTQSSLYSMGYIRSDRILALPPVNGTATRSSPGGVGLKTFCTGTTAFAHGAMLLWRHADADKIWFADGRTNAVTLTITAYA